MKVALLSDIHGNYDALSAVLDAAAAEGYKEIWTLGDLGGYGPEGDLCFDRLMSEKALLIPGNHDLYYAGKLSRDIFSPEALKALLNAGQKLSKPYREVMKSLPLTARRKGYTLVHGSLTDPARDYILNLDEAAVNFRMLKGKYLLFGHSHKQGCFLDDKEGLRWVSPEAGVSLSYKKRKALINPGSVGQPRDGDPGAAWAMLDTKMKEVRFMRTPYDIASYQEKMKMLGASDFLINRVEKGI